MKKLNKLNLPFWISFGIIVCLWFFSTANGFVDKLFLPSFVDLFNSFITLFSIKGFLNDIAISTWRVWVSFILSFLVALPLALAMSQSKIVYKIISPYIDFIRYLPVPTLIPLSILFLGIDESAKIALLFIGTFFQFILLILDDLKEIPKEYYELAYTLHYSKWEIIKMKIRAVLPQLYDNSRISIGICWTYLVIAELVASDSGIGHVIKEAQRFSQTPEIYAGIITIGLIGFITDFTFKKGYLLLFKYKNVVNGN